MIKAVITQKDLALLKGTIISSLSLCITRPFESNQSACQDCYPKTNATVQPDPVHTVKTNQVRQPHLLLQTTVYKYIELTAANHHRIIMEFIFKSLLCIFVFVLPFWLKEVYDEFMKDIYRRRRQDAPVQAAALNTAHPKEDKQALGPVHLCKCPCHLCQCPCHKFGHPQEPCLSTS